MFRPLNSTLQFLATTVVAGLSSAVVPNSPRPIDGFRHGRSTKYDYKVCPETPSLLCKNGSTCTPGVADYGGHEHLGLPTQDSGYYCKCLDGFIGHECGVQVEDCGVGTKSNPWACYHGSSCRSHGGEEYCDCEGLNASSGPTDMKFAGTMCQHESTSFCAASLAGQRSPNHQFCTNHGECARMVAEGDPHPGCICKGDWMGDHCEIPINAFKTAHLWTEEKGGMSAAEQGILAGVPFATTHTQREERGGGSATAKGILASLFVAVMLGIGARLMKWRAMKDAEMKSDDTVVFQGEGGASEGLWTKDENTVVGVGDLDPDGSATLRSRTEDEDSDSSGAMPPPTETFASTVVGVGDLEPDGSTTLGSLTKDKDIDAGRSVLANDAEII